MYGADGDRTPWSFAMGGVGGVCMIIELVGGGNGWRKII